MVTLRCVLLFLCLCASWPTVQGQTIPFVRGDANGSGDVDISDGIFTLSYVFFGARGPTCAAAADSNADGRLDVSDMIYSLSFVLLGGPRPPAPYPECGLPLFEGRLDCVRYDACDPDFAVSLAWDAPTEFEDGSVLSYLGGFKIYYGTESGNYYRVRTVGNRTSYSIYPLPTRSDTLYFSVTAYDSWGNESEFSEEICLPPLP